MLFAGGVVGLAALGFWLFCLLDVITSDGGQVRNLPKVFWVVIVLLTFEIGGLVWLVAGRPRAGNAQLGGLLRSGGGGAGRPARPTGLPDYERPPRPKLAPDDDPEFLARLRGSNQEHEHLLDNWEIDLRRREEELRRRERAERDDQPDPDPNGNGNGNGGPATSG